MKKIIALAAAAALCASAVFAENTIHLGLQFPSANLNVSGFPYSSAEYSSRGNYFSSGAGANFGYVHVSDGDFTFKIGLGLAGVGTSDIKSYSAGNNLGGVDFDLGLGFGGALIHNERITLSLTADLGLRVKGVSKKDYPDEDDSSVYLQTKMTTALFYLGPELSCTLRIGESVGMFASLGVFYNVGSSTYALVQKIYESSETDSFKFTTAGFSYHPKFGLSVSF